MNKVQILIKGYAKVNPDASWKASSTTTLIRAGPKMIIVDPGCNRSRLLNKLKKEGIKPEQIDIVFLTHHHLDHAINVALFPRAKVIDSDSMQLQDQGWDAGDMIPGTDIQILKTPGHEPFHASLFVPTEKGMVAVAGDVFWWEDGKGQDTSLEYKDDFAFNPQELVKSRKKLLELANYIIPGHGKMFRVKK